MWKWPWPDSRHSFVICQGDWGKLPRPKARLCPWPDSNRVTQRCKPSAHAWTSLMDVPCLRARLYAGYRFVRFFLCLRFVVCILKVMQLYTGRQYTGHIVMVFCLFWISYFRCRLLSLSGSLHPARQCSVCSLRSAYCAIRLLLSPIIVLLKLIKKFLLFVVSCLGFICN